MNYVGIAKEQRNATEYILEIKDDKATLKQISRYDEFGSLSLKGKPKTDWKTEMIVFSNIWSAFERILFSHMRSVDYNVERLEEGKNKLDRIIARALRSAMIEGNEIGFLTPDSLLNLSVR